MTENDKNNVNEPLSEYGEPVTFEQVWKMFQETNKQFHEIEERFRETDRKWQETDRKWQETDKRFQETDRKFQETDRKIDKLSKLYGGVSENSKDFAEEFFRRGLETRNFIFGIEYEEVDSPLARTKKKLQGEYDIVLHNGAYLIVIEVKYKLHPSDVEDFITRKLPKFKPLFSEYQDKKIIGAVAGMSVPAESYDIAEKNGLLVLTQRGEHIGIMNSEDFKPKEF